MTALAIDPERLKRASDVPLGAGSHSGALDKDGCPTGWCVMEKYAWTADRLQDGAFELLDRLVAA